jgi:hypothetical protein
VLVIFMRRYIVVGFLAGLVGLAPCVLTPTVGLQRLCQAVPSISWNGRCLIGFKSPEGTDDQAWRLIMRGQDLAYQMNLIEQGPDSFLRGTAIGVFLLFGLDEVRRRRNGGAA